MSKSKSGFKRPKKLGGTGMRWIKPSVKVTEPHVDPRPAPTTDFVLHYRPDCDWSVGLVFPKDGGRPFYPDQKGSPPERVSASGVQPPAEVVPASHAPQEAGK